MQGTVALQGLRVATRLGQRFGLKLFEAILEQGDHAALIALDGRYAELFKLQAAGFQ